MLARHQRLTTARFARTFEGGIILRHALLQGRMIRTEGDVLRAAFVAPRKLGPAVVRNRLRRRLGEVFRSVTRDRQAGALAGCDFIFIATPAAKTATPGQLGEAMDQLLRRATRQLHDRQPKENGE